MQSCHDVMCAVKSVPPPVPVYVCRWDERVTESARTVIRFCAKRICVGMSTATRRNSFNTGNGVEYDPDKNRSIRRELSIEYSRNDLDNIMETSKGRNVGKQSLCICVFLYICYETLKMLYPGLSFLMLCHTKYFLHINLLN